jgi:hypothetical protein
MRSSMERISFRLQGRIFKSTRGSANQCAVESEFRHMNIHVKQEKMSFDCYPQ